MLPGRLSPRPPAARGPLEVTAAAVCERMPVRPARRSGPSDMAACPLAPQISRRRAVQIGRRALLNDLTVLTPPLVVCAAFLIAVGAFLRHEMGTRRRPPEDTSVDISDDSGIPEQPGQESAPRVDEDARGSD